MPLLPFLLFLLAGSSLSQPTLDLVDNCDANNKVVDAVNENLAVFSEKMSDFESKLDNVKVDEDATKGIQDKLTDLGDKLDNMPANDNSELKQEINEIKKAINNIEIPVKYIEKCSNNTYTNPVYNKSCDRGWLKIENRCYYMQHYRSTLATNGQKWCADNFGARLATIESKEVFDQLKAGFPHTGDECHWVAAYRGSSGDDFYWEDCTVDVTGRQICSRESVNNTLWKSGFPTFAHYSWTGWNDQSSVYVCYTRDGFINRKNGNRRCICEYSL